jgi:hypothetical protein
MPLSTRANGGVRMGCHLGPSRSLVVRAAVLPTLVAQRMGRLGPSLLVLGVMTSIRPMVLAWSPGHTARPATTTSGDAVKAADWSKRGHVCRYWRPSLLPATLNAALFVRGPPSVIYLAQKEWLVQSVKSQVLPQGKPVARSGPSDYASINFVHRQREDRRLD